MPAPQVLSQVYRSLRAELGSEDAGYTFENGPGPLERLDVMVYRVNSLDALLFATIGMSVEAMPMPDERVGNRAELRLYRRGPLISREQGALAVSLANLAGYPWNAGSPLGWGEIVSFDEDVPSFNGCRSVFLAGQWMYSQIDHIETDVGAVRVINVVPITEKERTRAKAMQPEKFFSDLLDARDIFAPVTSDTAFD